MCDNLFHIPDIRTLDDLKKISSRTVMEVPKVKDRVIPELSR